MAAGCCFDMDASLVWGLGCGHEGLVWIDELIVRVRRHGGEGVLRALGLWVLDL